MTQPEALSREALYRNWLAWATTNLRDDPKYAAIAADAAVNGDGFNAAASAATNAWIEAAQSDKPLWRPGFWSLLFTDKRRGRLAAVLVCILPARADAVPRLARDGHQLSRCRSGDAHVGS
jgi:hypothetical protein